MYAMIKLVVLGRCKITLCAVYQVSLWGSYTPCLGFKKP